MNKGIIISAAAIVVAAGTYYGLDILFPPQPATLTTTDNSQASERVFGAAGLNETAAPAEPALPSSSEAEPAAAEDSAMADAAAPETEIATDDAALADDGELAVDAAEPAPESTPEPETPAVEPAMTPEAAAPTVPQPAPKPKAPTASKSPSSSSGPAPTWWGQSAAGDLGLVYAGSAAYARAIVLMFDGDFTSATAAGKQIRVANAAGKIVSGSWSVNDKNSRMLVFKVDEPGTYQVSLKAALADKSGRKLGRSQQGPVTVQ